MFEVTTRPITVIQRHTRVTTTHDMGVWGHAGVWGWCQLYLRGPVDSLRCVRRALDVEFVQCVLSLGDQYPRSALVPPRTAGSAWPVGRAGIKMHSREPLGWSRNCVFSQNVSARKSVGLSDPACRDTHNRI